jgi:hypothetical protein
LISIITSFLRNPHRHRLIDTIGTLDLPLLQAEINGDALLSLME